MFSRRRCPGGRRLASVRRPVRAHRSQGRLRRERQSRLLPNQRSAATKLSRSSAPVRTGRTGADDQVSPLQHADALQERGQDHVERPGQRAGRHGASVELSGNGPARRTQDRSIPPHGQVDGDPSLRQLVRYIVPKATGTGLSGARPCASTDSRRAASLRSPPRPAWPVVLLEAATPARVTIARSVKVRAGPPDGDIAAVRQRSGTPPAP